MKLEVGMYVRTKDNIMQVWKVYEPFFLNTKYKQIYNEEILKASHNIIDLIEVGDYVNGHQVIGKEIINQEEYVYTVKDRYGTYFKNSDIKSIVTKEQFESMSYKVGE